MTGNIIEIRPRAARFHWQMIVPVVWLVAVYIGTALTAGIDTTPRDTGARLLFEARHVAIHAVAFAVQVWLVAQALRLADQRGSARVGVALVGLALALGAGQEALQSLYRAEVRVLASSWDLAVDVLGGAIGWWLFSRRRAP